MKSYIRIPKTYIPPDSSIKKRQMSDGIWINQIFSIILKYYQKVNNNEIIEIIQKESKKNQSRIEKKLKENMYNWYKEEIKKNKELSLWGFILNLESSSDNFEGFVDLKFQHSDWSKSFEIEAKNLGKTKSTGFSKTLSEYVYIKTKNREDGGMFRFINCKYAKDTSFGGMIGFIVGKITGDLINKLTEKIFESYKISENGRLTGKKIIYDSIANNKNTFTTIHMRKNVLSKKVNEFTLYHIILDFCEVSL